MKRVVKVLLIFAVIILASAFAVPTEATNDFCGVDWMQSPGRLFDYLWGQFRSDMVQRWPNLTAYGPENSRPLGAILAENTSLAIQLSSTYGFEISGTDMAHGGVHVSRSYGDFWNPVNFGAKVQEWVQRGASISEVRDCLTTRFGFDEDFTAASINYANTRVATYYFCVLYRQHMDAFDGSLYNRNCLDPAIYGKNPFVIQWQDPSWILGVDGHIYMGQFPSAPSECGSNAVQSNTTRVPPYDELGIPQNTPWDYLYNRCITIDKVLGGSTNTLIIPEAVASKFTRNDLSRMSSFFTVWVYGIKPSFGDAGPDGGVQFTQNDFSAMQSSYKKVMSALKDYGAQVGYDFTTISKVPVDDTRLPEDFRKKIVWLSYPDPLQEQLEQVAEPTCTVAVLNNATPTHPAECVQRGSWESSYATRLFKFLRVTGGFSQNERTSYFLRFLGHFFSQDQLGSINTSLLANYGEAETQFQAALGHINDAVSFSSPALAPASSLDATANDPASAVLQFSNAIADNLPVSAWIQSKGISSSTLPFNVDKPSSPQPPISDSIASYAVGVISALGTGVGFFALASSSRKRFNFKMPHVHGMKRQAYVMSGPEFAQRIIALAENEPEKHARRPPIQGNLTLDAHIRGEF